MRMSLRKIEITSGGYLLLAVLVFMLDPVTLFVLFGNIYIHELGHFVLLSRFGAYIRKVSLCASGLCIQCNTGYMSAKALFLCAAGGPFFGMVSALISSALGSLLSYPTLHLFAGVGLLLSLFNLLPAKPLDGWRMLFAVSPRLAVLVGVPVSCAVLICGLVLMYFGYGIGLAMMGVILLLKNDPLERRFGMREFG